MSALADVAAAIADRTRARMLEELLGGPPLPAGALAVTRRRRAVDGQRPPRAARGGGARDDRGRAAAGARRGSPARTSPRRSRRWRRIAGDEPRPVGLRAVNGRAALREARSCYDHLAGRAGVALADGLLARGALTAMAVHRPRRRGRLLPRGVRRRPRRADRPPPARARLHRLDRAPPAPRRRAGRRAARVDARARLARAAARRARAERHARVALDVRCAARWAGSGHGGRTRRGGQRRERSRSAEPCKRLARVARCRSTGSRESSCQLAGQVDARVVVARCRSLAREVELVTSDQVDSRVTVARGAIAAGAGRHSLTGAVRTRAPLGIHRAHGAAPRARAGRRFTRTVSTRARARPARGLEPAGRAAAPGVVDASRRDAAAAGRRVDARDADP